MFNPIAFVDRNIKEFIKDEYIIEIQNLDKNHYHFLISKYKFVLATICFDDNEFKISLNNFGATNNEEENWWDENGLMFLEELFDLGLKCKKIVETYKNNNRSK